MSETIFDNQNPVKNNEKYFLSDLKSSFHAQDISVFGLDFLDMKKNHLIRKTRSVSKFMASRPG